MKKQEQLPVYSLQAFSSPERRSQQFQVEPFDARRHFQVKYPHRHDFYEVLFLMGGSGMHIIDGKRYEVIPPCVFFLSPGQVHDLEFSNDIDGYIFLFSPEFYLIHHTNPNRLLEFPFFYSIQQTNPPLILQDKNDVRFLELLFQKGIDASLNMSRQPIEFFRSLLDLILNFCAGLYPRSSQLVENGRGHLLVKRFFQLVEDHFRMNYSIGDYARLLAVSPGYLTQTVKQMTGKSSQEIIHAKIMLEIKRLLVYTNLGIAEIAERMHFSDQSYFTKFFKRGTGITPLMYRSRNSK
ncbi:MAG TPA: AraC family transcriptional regulator [Prolixibacteraceae bacterium]|nr:AraC family transcriptional regulator [Prolixibacteraceae bacterium]